MLSRYDGKNVKITTTDGSVSRYKPTAEGESVDDLLEVEFVTAEDEIRSVEEAVETIAEEMKE